jgi:hypothetical protein
MRNLFFILIILLNVAQSKAQQNIRLKSSAAIESLMEKFVTQGKSTETVKAWRVQIITSTDRHEMETARTTFSSLYPSVNSDWKHVAPYYQLRVGYFENKNKLMPFLLELKKTFPSSTPVYDQMSKRSLVN